MNRFEVGNAVSLQLTYVDDNGEAITPSAVTYEVFDETDTLVAGPVAVSSPWTSPQDVTVPGSYNNAIGGRRLVFTITYDAGVTYLEQFYEIRNSTQRLIFLTNSFQTFLQAKLVGNSLSSASGFQNASEDDAINALIEAYYRLTQFAYRIKWPAYINPQSILYLEWDRHPIITPQMWPVMNPTLFAQYPTTFQDAMKRAQVVEANAILTPNPARDKQRAGILADSVGESKVMFKGGIRPLDFGIDRATLGVIRQFLWMRTTIARTS